jgi:peptidoglycan L-alanyl-D-glutamate endopeptidase CwlK
MNPTSEERLVPIYPRLARLIRELANTMHTKHQTEIIVSFGIRTSSEQDALWAKGRTTLSPIGCVHDDIAFKPGTCPKHPLGVPVTNARGGYSWHNFGMAVDCAPLNIKGGIDWNAAHPQWRIMEEEGVSLGLVNGAHWIRLVDAPHFQLTGRFPMDAPTDEVRRLATGGLSVLWAEVEKSYAGAQL